MNEKFDIRDKKTFTRDIKKSHRLEMEIAIRLGILHKHRFHEWPIIRPAGTDFKGEFVSDRSKVTTDPDFLINGIPTEITCSEGKCRSGRFHEKEWKVKRCIKDGINLVFVNGITSEKQPLFINLGPSELSHFSDISLTEFGITGMLGHKHQGWINKPSYRYKISWFNDLWMKLPPICDIPKEYEELLDFVR